MSYRRKQPIVDVEQLPPNILHQIQRGLDLDNKWQNFASEIGLTAQDIHQYEFKARNGDRGPSWHMFQNWYAKCPTILHLVAVLIKLGRDSDLTKLRTCIHNDNIISKIDEYLEERHREDHDHISSILPENESGQNDGSNYVIPQEPSRPSMPSKLSSNYLPPSIPIQPTAPDWQSVIPQQPAHQNKRAADPHANLTTPGRAAPFDFNRQYSNAPTLIPPSSNLLPNPATDYDSSVSCVSSSTSLINGNSTPNKKYSRIAELRDLLDIGCCTFSREEIDVALTNRGETALFHGRLGNVRRALLRETYIAIKTLENVKDTKSRSDQILNEVKALVKFRHPSILPLMGYCYQIVGSHLNLYLLYPYMWSSTLWDVLYMHRNPPFNALDRLECLYRVASAVHFLHSNRPRPAYHGNIRTENVLFNEHMVPSLCGFSFCRVMHESDSDDKGGVSDHAVFQEDAYTCPEKVHSPAGDVFSFGVLMLETWLNENSRSSRGTLSLLVEHAHNKFIQSDSRMLMPKVEYELFTTELNHSVLSLVVSCTSRNQLDRPSILTVMKELDQLMETAPNMQSPPAYEPPTSDGYHDVDYEEK